MKRFLPSILLTLTLCAAYVCATNYRAVLVPDGVDPNSLFSGQTGINTNAAVGFSAYRSAAQAPASASTYYTATMDIELYDSHSAYNTNTYQYTVPKTGLWLLTHRERANNIDDANIAVGRIMQVTDAGATTNQLGYGGGYSPRANGRPTVQTAVIVPLSAGDVVYAEILDDNATRDTSFLAIRGLIEFSGVYLDTIWGE